MALEPGQTMADRPFTSVALYEPDTSTLTCMLEDVRMLLSQSRRGTYELAVKEMVAWSVYGLKRRVIVCEPEVLVERSELCIVGFFADRNLDLDLHALDEANTEIVREFDKYPGILSYSSFELPGGNWANLVIHDEPEAAERWRESEVHARAVADLSPTYYKNVRIHNGLIPGGLNGGRSIVIYRTKYWDYSEREVWTAVREIS